MRTAIIGAVLSMFAGAASACGAESDCVIGDRHYRIALPDATAPVGAVVHAHGYRGTAAGVMRNGALRRALADRGLALIALKSLSDDWVIPHAPGHPDATGAEEVAYVAAVLDDASARFGLDPARMVAAGFSAGGMMVWMLACALPDRFAGFVAIAGTFWQGPPESCATPPASLVHIHGTSDPTVPLGGRPIRETRQGDVAEVIAFYRAFGGFATAAEVAMGDLACTQRRNGQGAILDLCLHPGGHSFRTGHLMAALDRLGAAGRF